MSDFWNHYVEILSDGPHLAVETSFTFADFIIFTVIWGRIKKMIKREHRLIDREHNHVHDEEVSELSRKVTDRDIVDALTTGTNSPGVEALIQALVRNNKTK